MVSCKIQLYSVLFCQFLIFKVRLKNQSISVQIFASHTIFGIEIYMHYCRITF